MNVLMKLSMASLRKNRKRTIMTIIGVILSTALICAVAGMVTSARASLIRYARESGGDFHYLFYDVPEEKTAYIENNANTADSFRIRELGYAAYPDSNNRTRPYYLIHGSTADGLGKLKLSLESGRLPENASEIVISDSAVYNGGKSVKPGDELVLAVGNRTDENGQILTEFTPYDDGVPEHLENTAERRYTVVGVISEPYTVNGYYPSAYSLYTCLSEEELNAPGGSCRVGVTLSDPQKCLKTKKEILQAVYPGEEEERMNYVGENHELLKFQGALGISIVTALQNIMLFILGIIVVTSVFVIRNSFRMSVSEKTRQYGMLISVGATSRQIRKTVLYEGMLTGLVGIPAGILLGVGVVAILVWLLNVLLPDITTSGIMAFVYDLPPVVIAAAAALGALTIWLSCIIPAYRAAKIAPIEAIRSNADVKISAKDVRAPKRIQKLFGIGGLIAAKNLRRSRKKYRTTVVSLVVSIAVFIALSSFVSLGRQTVGMAYADYPWNLWVSIRNEGDSAGIRGVYDEILNEKGIEEGMYAFAYTIRCDADAYATAYGKDSFSNSVYYDPSGNPVSDADQINTTMILISRDYFARFCRELGITQDPSEVAILEDDILTVGYEGENVRSVEHYYDILEGSTVHYSAFFADEAQPEAESGSDGGASGESVQKEFDITITKISDVRPLGYVQCYGDGGYLFVSEDFADGMFLSEKNCWPEGLYVQAEDPNALEARLMERQAREPEWSSISVENITKKADQERRIILVMEIFLYGFIIVITLIGVTNIFNTISTNMMLRSREFAMLRSVGMTNREFVRMIRLESLMYGVRSLVIGIACGIAGSLLIYRLVAEMADWGYRFPLVPILISIGAVFLIVGMTMRYSLSRIGRQNLVETIRSEAI